uniref:Ig-like domain-containing protein n=1 Tax=Neolamprologus brichardi TaxID=32507 RepID=A0A3Q4HPF4_NEOBR
MQPAISIQLNRAQSNGHKVQLIYSTRVSAHLDPTSQLSSSSAASHPWVMISTNHTTTALATVAGSKVQLPCPILTSGNPKAQWILPDGSELLSPSSTLDGRLRASGFVLLLQNVQLSDAGIYYCVARAGRDIDVLPLHLAVEESSVPHLGEQVGPPVTGTVGEPVSLPCRMSGSPEPYLSWILPNGNVVLTLPSDRGVYRCVASNSAGAASTSVRVHVSSLPPVIHYHVMKVRQGATARIPCRATGNPTPTVTWFNPANRVIPQSLGSGYYFERVVVVSNGTLEVRVAQKVDTGNYTCQASNSAGERSRVVRLEVETPTYGLHGREVIVICSHLIIF